MVDSSRRLVILGSTGSIGTSALEVVDHLAPRFEVVGLVAGRRVELLAQQVTRYRPRIVACGDEDGARRLRALLDGGPVRPRVVWGERGAIEAVREGEPDVVLAAIVGAAGLAPTLAAVETGATVGLANKEALVVAGRLMVERAAASGATLLPVDSEHNAIHQCLRSGRREEVRRLVLTASGGPFRGRAREELAGVSVAEALDHPTWSMGDKITIDSATLMNKGLEVIEAHFLFAADVGEIDVLVHPQSIVHSLVEFRDGSVIAQLGVPDMRHPIQYALTWPDRVAGCCPRLDLAELGTLTFEQPDLEAFPCLALAYEALRLGGDAPARLNAANEVAVEAFLDGRIGFLDIPRVIERTLARTGPGRGEDLDALRDADRQARRVARSLVSGGPTA
ncbi:MAG: 1-deoxy-D-xylulose-5-phosphate reductoisomerase [Acidobacteria bacterium]|nr:MAG: 1-deoxy-D-xylulose-5-phosphate reductoisomerase [Acidobacteriota bacterium]